MVNLEKHFTALLIFGSFLFVNVCYSNNTTHTVPSNTPQTTTQTTPVEVKTGKAVNAIHNQAKFWGGLANAKRQMEKMEKDREELAKTIPRGEIRKYDVVVRGTEFVGFMESDKPQLRHGDSKTGAIVEIKGTCPTKAEIASREAAQKAESERLAMEAAAKAEREVNFTSAYAIETVIIEKKQFQDIDDIEYTIEFVVRKGKDKDKFLDVGHTYIIWRKQQNDQMVYDKQLFMSSIQDISISSYKDTPDPNNHSRVFLIYPKDYDSYMNIQFKKSFCKIDGNNDYTNVSFLNAGGYVAYMCDSKQAFGFYPFQQQPTLFRLTVPGTIEDEFTNESSNKFEPTHKMIVTVDALTFEKTRMSLFEWRLLHNRYRPLSMDCITFSQEIASAINLLVPERNASTIKPEDYIKELIVLNNQSTTINHINHIQ